MTFSRQYHDYDHYYQLCSNYVKVSYMNFISALFEPKLREVV